jgi:hypothetical protein
MNKVGILASSVSSEQMKFAKSVASCVKNSSKNTDVVIFYDSLSKIEEYPNVSFLSSDHIWSFTGTLITMSLLNFHSVLDIPLKIHHIYHGDYDQYYDPLMILYLTQTFKLTCITEDFQKKLQRTIGKNKEINKYETVEDLVGDIL